MPHYCENEASIGQASVSGFSNENAIKQSKCQDYGDFFEGIAIFLKPFLCINGCIVGL